MTEQQQRYRVVEKLESGGMAEVFRAESEGLQGFKKQVAIKRVLPHLSEKKKFIAMFLDEARLSAQLSHSNCVQVFDIGVGDNAYFIVMEYVDGANLKSIAEGIKRQGRDFPVQAAAFIAQEICKGLSYAHEMVDSNGGHMEIVHRDMSPPNVLVTKHGEVKIVDFGLAKASSQLEKSEAGIIKGKFSYLSPEAAMGHPVDHRTDIFAVGIILWELLSGQRLFLGETDFQTVKRVQLCQVPAISQLNPRVPPELERIVNGALVRDPDQRYQTARELGQDLVRFLFAYGQPVGTFDISSLVQSTIKQRAKVQQSLETNISKLIEETLFEFTSLKTDQEPDPNSPAQMGASGVGPLNPDQFVDPTNWADEIALERTAPRQDPTRGLPRRLEAGNLSALEDTQLHSGSPPPPPMQQLREGPMHVHQQAHLQHMQATMPLQGQGGVAQRPSGNLVAQMVYPPSPKKGGMGGALIGVTLFLVAAAAAAAAYLSGFIQR